MVALPSSSNIDRPQAAGYDAAVNDLLVRFVLDGQNALRIRSLQAAPELPNVADQPEDVTTRRNAVSIGDVTGGSNLFFGHRLESESGQFDRSRFWSSRGIDNAPTRPGETAGFRLLADTEQAIANASTNPFMVAVGSVVFFAVGSTIERADSVLSSSSTVTEDPHTGTADVTGLAVLGSEVFAAVGTDGIGKRAAGGTWSDLATPPANVLGLWAAKGRLIADVNGAVAEVDTASGTPTTVFNLPSGVTVTDIAETGPAILVTATNGVIYALTTDGSGNLVLASENPLAPYEFPTCIAHAFGTIVVGTSVPTVEGGNLGRIYSAQVGTETESYGIADLQLIYEFDRSDRTLDRAPKAIVQRRDSLYVAVAETAGTVLYRYHLSTGSVTEDLIFATEATARSLTVINDRLIITRDGQGVGREMDSFVSSGHLITPAFDFFSSEEKTWLEGIVLGELPADTSIDFYVTGNLAALLDPDHTDWTRIQRVTVAETLGLEARIYSLTSRYLAMKFVLRSNAGSRDRSPIVSAATAFAEFASSQIAVQMPINVSDRIERSHRKPITLKGWGRRILQALTQQVGASITLTLYNEQMTVIGAIVDIDTSSIGTGERAGRSVVAIVTVLGRIESIGINTSQFSGTALGTLSIDGTVTLGA